MRAVHYLHAVFACVFATSCSRDDLGSYELFRTLALARRVEVIVPPHVDAAPLEVLAVRTRERGRWSVEIERGSEFDDGAARLWIGDRNVTALGTFVQLNGVVFEPNNGAVWFDGLRYFGPDEAVQLCVEDPDRPGWPVTVLLASDAAFAARYVTELEPIWKPGFRCWRAGRIEREGVWNDFGEGIESSAAPVLQALAGWKHISAEFEFGELSIHGPVDAAALERTRETLERVGRNVVKWLGAPRERVTVHVWPDQESFAAATGSLERSWVGFGEWTAHMIVEPDVPDDAGRSFAIALARSCAGRARDPWIEDALAVAASASWRGMVPLADWREHLARRGLLTDWRASLAPQSELSPHVHDARRAVVIDELLRQGRTELVRRAWSEGAAELTNAAEALDLSFAETLRGAEATRSTSELRVERRTRALSRGFLRGVHLVSAIDADGRSPWTYGSDKCFRALDELRAKGVNTVALRPTYSRAERSTFWPRSDRPRPFDSAFSDDQLLATAAYARKIGLGVMLAPQLLDAPASALADVTMTGSRENVERFFAAQRSLLVHCGLLAQLADIDILCIGSDLLESTNTQAFEIESGWTPPDYLLTNTARWREVLRDVRNVFDGALTYAASGSGEILSIDVWSELDFVGLDFYRVITPDYKNRKPPDEGDALRQIRFGFERLNEYAARFDRPCLITEVGFAATSRNWLDPKVPAGDYDVFEQQRLFEAFGQSLGELRRENRGPAGVFVWCWTIDPERGQGVDRGFTLSHRPAADRLPDVFGGD